MEDGKGGMTAKGIKKKVIKKDIMHEDYKNTSLTLFSMGYFKNTTVWGGAIMAPPSNFAVA